MILGRGCELADLDGGGEDACTAFFLPLLCMFGSVDSWLCLGTPPFFSRPGPDGPLKLSVGINAKYGTHMFPMKQFSLGGLFGGGTKKGRGDADTKLPKSVEQNSKIAQKHGHIIWSPCITKVDKS